MTMVISGKIDITLVNDMYAFIYTSLLKKYLNKKYKNITKKSREIIELNHDSFNCVKDMLNKIN